MRPPPTVPYAEDFTSYTMTCDAAFSTSSCPSGWEGVGDNDSLEYVDAGGDAGIVITPGLSTPNGFSTVFTVDPSDGYFQQKATAWATGGTATFVVRHRFKDSNGVTVGTSTYTHTAVSGPTTITPFDDISAIPATAVTVKVLIGAVNPSNSSVLVEVPGTMVEFQSTPCVLCWLVSTAGEECPPLTSCDANISCPDDVQPTCFCDSGTYPACTPVVSCTCPVVKLGP